MTDGFVSRSAFCKYATCLRLLALFCLSVLSATATATFHLWKIDEIFSNADGTIQFLELETGAAGQQFIAGHLLTSSNGQVTKSFTFPADLPGDSSNRRMLIGTSGFATVSGITPDYVVPDQFFALTNGSVDFAGVDAISWSALPTDGTLSADRFGGTHINSPTNFSGATGSLSLGSARTGLLENPVGNVVESGIGVISGWHCTAEAIVITIDETVNLGLAGSGTLRYDTARVCGVSTTGFSLLYNWNNLQPGPHVIRAYADGVLLATKSFVTVRSAGGKFVRGLAKTAVVTDFPEAGKSTTLEWREATQSFVITGVTQASSRSNQGP